MTKFFENFISEKNRIISRLIAYRDYVFIFKDWYRVIFPLNKFFSGKQLLMHLRNGMTVYIRNSRSKDLSVIREVIGRNDYHLENFFLKDASVIFDIGANIGTFSLMAKSICPNSRIIAFEPHPENFSLLIRNAPFAECKQIAVTNITGKVDFEAKGSPIGFKVKKDGGLSVLSATLAEITKEFDRVDLIKIDVEGSEYSILRNVSPGVFSKVGYVIVEVHANEEFSLTQAREFMSDLLSKNGFKVSWLKPTVLFAKK